MLGGECAGRVREKISFDFLGTAVVLASEIEASEF